MKKFLGIVVLGFLLAGCATNTDGTFSMGVKGSAPWHATAGHQELLSYYLESDVDEICHIWKQLEDYNRDMRVRNRKAMKEALISKKIDPLFCMKLSS